MCLLTEGSSAAIIPIFFFISQCRKHNFFFLFLMSVDAVDPHLRHHHITPNNVWVVLLSDTPSPKENEYTYWQRFRIEKCYNIKLKVFSVQKKSVRFPIKWNCVSIIFNIMTYISHSVVQSHVYKGNQDAKSSAAHGTTTKQK